MTVLTTQNLLVSMCTITYQNLGGIGVTPNESNGPESNGPSTGVTLTKFVYGLNPIRTRWIRHFWIGGALSFIVANVCYREPPKSVASYIFGVDITFTLSHHCCS
jgi:hypothetical protein